jgi:hypothetical protein
VQRLVAVPDPLRHLAPEALADPAPQRIVSKRDSVAIRPRYFSQLPRPVPGVVPLLPIGQGLPRQVAFRVVLVAYAPGPLQLPAGTVGTVRARRRAKQVAHRIGLAHVLCPVGIHRPGERTQRVVGVARGARYTVLNLRELVRPLPLVAAAARGPAARAEALAGGPARCVVLPVQAQAPAQLAMQLQPLGIAPHHALPTTLGAIHPAAI